MKFPLPPDNYGWEDRRVCASKIFQKADNIVMVIASLIWKLFNSEIEAKRTALCRAPAMAHTMEEKEIKQGKFRAVDENGYFFVADSDVVEKLAFRSPEKTPKQFYLIRQNNGRDGKVWLSVDKDGRLAMVKFRKSRGVLSKLLFEEDEDEAIDEASELNHPSINLSLAKVEQRAWEDAYGHLGPCAFIATLAGKEALVMPFCFCYQRNGVLSLDLSSYLPFEDVSHEEIADWDAVRLLLEGSADIGVVNHLFTAIETLASKSVCHLDIKWEHLALLPVFDEGGTLERIEPILIDLAEVDMTRSPSDALSFMCQSVLDSGLLISNDQKEIFQVLVNSTAL